MKAVVPGQLDCVSICSIAPLSIFKFMLLDRTIGPLKYVLSVPADGISTVPPPAAAAALMVLWIAAALFVTPSPTAPKLVTLNTLVGMFGNSGGDLSVTVSTALVLVVVPTELLATTVYVPASDDCTFVRVNAERVAPETGTLFLFHW